MNPPSENIYRRILAVKWRRLGDTVLWTSSLEALRQQFPKADITLALPRPYLPLFSEDSRFNRLIPLSEDVSLGEIATEINKESYDCFLGFHASGSVRRLAKKTGIRPRVLHHHSRRADPFSSDLSIPFLGEPMSAQERDLNVVRALGFKGNAPMTRIAVSDDSRAKAKAFLKGRGWKDGQKLVFLHPGASREAKKWGLEHYLKLANSLASSPDHPFIGVIVESDMEWEREKYLLNQILKTAVEIRVPALLELAATLSHGSVLAGSDSGIKHLAAAVGIPTVTLFGPESIGEWHGYPPERNVAIQKQVLCRYNDPEIPKFAWCGEEICPFSSHSCLSLISEEEVLTEIKRFI